jgi:hypothetical protein
VRTTSLRADRSSYKRKLPRWKAEWRAATTSDEAALARAIEAMEPRWRWPWQRG